MYTRLIVGLLIQNRASNMLLDFMNFQCDNGLWRHLNRRDIIAFNNLKSEIFILNRSKLTYHYYYSKHM